jgi:hypothetical protein
MDSKNITRINKKALLNINNLVDRIDPTNQTQAVTVELKFSGLFDVNTTIKSIIDAIYNIALHSENLNEESSIITDLCRIAEQLIPVNESQFIDDLIIEKSYNEADFVPLESL